MSDEPDWQDEPAAEGDARRPARSVRPPAAASLVRFGRADRGPGLLVGAIVVFVAVAVIKPWPGGSAAPAPPPAPVIPDVTAAPASLDPLAGIRVDCEDPPGWRIFSRESWGGGVLRSWRTFDPQVSASGPLDPAIPDIPIGPGILALGYCGVWTGAARPPDNATVSAWSIGDGGQVSRPLSLVPASPTLHPPLGGLYGPPDGAAMPAPATPAPRDGAWPRPGPTIGGLADQALDGSRWRPGTYVFLLGAPAYARWWAVTILPDTRLPSPSSRT